MPKRKKKFKGDPATLMQSFSKNLLGLKFMQRIPKAVEKDPLDSYEDDSSDEEEEEKNKNKDISIQLDTSALQKLKANRKFIINPSYQCFQKLKFGRLSFKGMNMDIESIMANNRDLDTSRNSSGSRLNQSLEVGVSKRPAEDEWDNEED